MSSSRFAEKIRQLEREGQSLLVGHESPSSASASVAAVVDSKPRLSSSVRQRVSEDDLLNKSRVEESLSRSVPPHQRAASAGTLPSTSYSTPTVSFSPELSALGWISPPKAPTPGLYTGNNASTILQHPPSGTPPTYLLTNNRISPLSASAGGGLSQSLLSGDRRPHDRQLRQAQCTIDSMKEQLRQAQKLSEDHRKQFRVSNEDLNRRLQDALIERDRLAATRVTEASSQDELIDTLQCAVTELHRTSDSQKRTIEETEKQVELLQLIRSDHNNMVDLLRTVMRTAERRRGRSFYDSEPIDKQSSAMLVHSLERCLDEAEQERESYTVRIDELERQMADMRTATLEIERTTTKSHEERYQRMREDLESRLRESEERANNSKQQSESLKQQLDMITEQYRGSELLREEQNRMLEERVEMLKSHLDGQNRDSQSKLESVSVALDSTQKELTNAMSSKDELVRRYAGLEEKVKDFEVTIEKLNNELDMEREQTRKVWEKDNEILNRNVEIETKMALRDAEMARLEALLEKTKDECAKQITQEVSLAEKYQQEKHAEEKSILVKQVDSLTDRHTKANKDLQETQVENARLLSQLKNTLDKLSHIEKDHMSASDDKQSLQSQLITKNEVIDKVTQERDQYIHMIEQRNNQFNELSLACERSHMQRDEKERHCVTLESSVNKLEERLSQAHQELNNYQQETAALHRTRDEFDCRIREMETAVDKQTKKLKNKDKKIADADSEKQRLEELVAHKTDTVQQLEEQLRAQKSDIKENRREISMLSEESNALKSVMKGQEGEMQREINNLILKMKAVEHDYKLAKKALKSREHVDKQATDMANKLQVELTEQRKHSDDLRTKIRWLEDSLDKSKKDKDCVEEQCDQLQLELEHRCKGEQRQEQIMSTERSKASMLESKVVSLEDGLKEAISRCSTLQASAERSEQDMYKLKLKHQLELKELQQRIQQQQVTGGESQSGGIVLPPPPSPPKQQDEGIATELKTVLKDMKSLLSSAQERKVYHRRTNSDRSFDSNYTDMSQHSEPSTYRSKDSRRRRKSAAESVDVLLKPTSARADSERSHRSGGHRSRENRENRAPSGHHNHHHHHGGSSSRHKHTTVGVSEPLKTEAQVLCQNLERKLEKLTKIGQEASGDSGAFVSRKHTTTPASYEKLHRYLRSQKS